MTNAVEQAILDHIEKNSKDSLRHLYRVALANEFVVPVSEEPRRDEHGNLHVQFKYVEFADGVVGAPIFTSVERMHEWSDHAQRSVKILGRGIFDMFARRPEIQVVLVNFSKKAKSPKGGFSRREFEMLAKGILPAT